MNVNVMASKKSKLVIAIAVLVIAGIIYQTLIKQNSTGRQAEIGAQLELSTVGRSALSQPELMLIMGSSRRVSHIIDLRTPIAIVGKNVMINVRAVDVAYPLYGTMNIEHPNFQDVFAPDRQKEVYGVAVNQLFLDRTGLKMGDIITVGSRHYQLRGLIQSMPDKSGEEMATDALMILRHPAMPGSGLFKQADTIRHGYRIIPKRTTPEKWEQMFKQKFPNSIATITRWDS